ncbi:MAG: diguanylate cyclase (GGDEF)-like protein [Sulfurimonas sp.]|jgi:diguanylate cyclase (GGDEF)-like protein|uniref:diguanylate cyclase n=1 Tax=Sulfurimonas sp. TaxID=2022749 RepID=UPI0039E72974
MKHSIYKIFKNLHIFLLFILTLSTISLLFIVEQYYSYEKVNNLNNQKTVLLNILTQQEISNEVNIYLYNAKIASLNNDINKLHNKNQYNYLSVYLLDNTTEYISDLNHLYSLIQNFDKESRKYFELNKITQTDKDKLNTSFIQITSNIDSLILKNILYDQEKFSIFSKILILIFILLLLTTIWYKKRLTKIYNDILFLYTIDTNKNKEIFTQEVAAIQLRMTRKTQIADNPAMMDPVTEIHNNKGMIQAYLERKTPKDTNFSSVTILEIDNFSKSKRTFSQEFTQAILKKVAYTISLHQQATDIIARSDYNQFTLIFTRPSTEQLFKHTDLIRQSISEIKLATPEKETIQISVTGGFISKPNHAPLEKSIRKAKELLKHTKELGNNRIIQMKDIPK